MAARLETSEAFAIDHIKRCYLNEHFLISQPIYTAQFTFFTQDFLPQFWRNETSTCSSEALQIQGVFDVSPF